MSSGAYTNLVDNVPDLRDKNYFKKYSNVAVKHNQTLDIYQFTPTENDYLNVNPPMTLELVEDFKSYAKSSSFMQIIGASPEGLQTALSKLNEDEQQEMLKNQVELFKLLEGLVVPTLKKLKGIK
jgi:hypothetical protein